MSDEQKPEEGEAQYNPFEVDVKYEDFPKFFQGMCCAYEDTARMLDQMRENLPPELKFMDEGMQTMIAGVRGKIAQIEVLILTKHAKEQAEREAEKATKQ